MHQLMSSANSTVCVVLCCVVVLYTCKGALRHYRGRVGVVEGTGACTVASACINLFRRFVVHQITAHTAITGQPKGGGNRWRQSVHT